MSIYNVIFAIAVLVSGALSIGHRNALLWLSCIAADYAISVFWWRHSLPQGEFVTGICDAAVCLAIFVWGQRRWELWIYVLFQLSVLIDIVYLCSNMGGWALLDQDTYSTALEIINAVAILTIGGVSAWRTSGQTDARAFNPWVNFLGFVRPFHGKTGTDSR